MTGSDAVVRSLSNEGVNLVFGIPGYHSEHLYGRLMRQQQIRHVLVRHEQGAGFMAIGAARVTGKPACVISTAGPGALNITTPMGEAYGDSVPLLNILAEDLSDYLYQDRGLVHESKDQFGIFSRLTQWSHQAMSPGEIPRAFHEAIRRMEVNRPRPTTVEIPIDVFPTTGTVNLLTHEEHPRPRGNPTDIERAAALLHDATHPLIWAGGGVISSGAWHELRQVAERLQAPVLSTCSGKGSIPDDHPLSLMNIATHGPAIRLMDRCDVMLAVGAVFPYLMTNKWRAPIPKRLIHIDIDPNQPSKNYPAEIGIHADARLALTGLLAALDRTNLNRDAWVDTARTALSTVRKEMAKQAPLEWNLMKSIRDALPRDTIVACDPHLLGYWARDHFPVYQGRTFLYGLQFGTLGYAYPVALGAKLASPNQPVVALGGDGGFLFTGQELATAVQQNLPVPMVIFNDNAYGAIKEDFMRDYGEAYEVNLTNPDFVRYAEAFGAVGMRATPDELGPTLRRALSLDKPSIIEVPVQLHRPVKAP